MWSATQAVLRVLVLAAAALAVGNLLFEQNLPGAVYIEHAVFSIVVGIFLFLTEEGWILPVVVLSLVLLGTVLFLLRRSKEWPWRIFLGGLSLTVAAGQMGFVFFGTLMEKELTVAILAGLALIFVRQGFDKKPDLHGDEKLSRRQMLVVASFSAISLYYLFMILGTDPSGYHLLHWAGRFFRENSHGASGLIFAFYGVMGLGAILAIALFFRGKEAGRRLPPYIAALTLLIGVLLFYRYGLGRDIKMAGEILIGLTALFAADAFGKWGFPIVPDLSLAIVSYPKKMVYLCFIAFLCMAHVYAFRVFACPTHPALTRLGDAPEVFRAVLTEEGRTLFLVYRTRNQIVRLDLEGDAGAAPVDPGVLGDLSLPEMKKFWGVPEDLIVLPERGLLAATFSPYPDLYETLLKGNQKELKDIVILIDPKKNAVTRVFPLTDICWINSIRWNAQAGTIFIGCEDEKRLLTLDIDDGRILRDAALPAVGDIQDLEIDTRYDPQRLYIVSLWYNARVTQLAGDTWQPSRQLFVGGANYETAFSPANDLLFIGRFYESRVVVVDTKTFKPVGILRTGLGTRAVQVDEKRNLLLVSSIYDGGLRIFDITTLKLLFHLKVGGHVKSIALDEERGFAYFGSQCGLFRLDLDLLLESP